MTMTKEEKTELKTLRKRLKEIERAAKKETAEVLKEQREIEHSHEQTMRALGHRRERELDGPRHLLREQKRAHAAALKLAESESKKVTRQMRSTQRESLAAVKLLHKRRKQVDANHGETKAVMDRIAVLEGRLAA